MNPDSSPGVAADAPDLTEAERKVRAYLAVHGDDNMERVLVEYDRRGAELARVRAAVTSAASVLAHMAAQVRGVDRVGWFQAQTYDDAASRLRETLTPP